MRTRWRLRESAQRACESVRETIQIGVVFCFRRANQQCFFVLRIFFAKRESSDDVVVRESLDNIVCGTRQSHRDLMEKRTHKQWRDTGDGAELVAQLAC